MMTNMPVLDVAIGVIFMYLLLSLIVTTIQEALAGLGKWRARNLFDAVARLLEDPKLTGTGWAGLATDVYRHPLISKLCKGALGTGTNPKTFGEENKANLPSYIPSRTFALALLDVLRDKAKATQASGMDAVLAGADEIVGKLPAGELQQVLLLLVGDAKGVGRSV